MIVRNAFLVLVGAALVGTAWTAVTLLRPHNNISSPSGELKVQYMVQTGPGSAEGSELDKVSAIEFHPAYVIIKRLNGSGFVFFTDKTQKLSWGPRVQNESDQPRPSRPAEEPR